MKHHKSRPRRERDRIQLMQQAIESRASYSLAVLGMAFVRNGSGRFLNIRAVGDRLQRNSGLSTDRILKSEVC